VAGLRFYAFPLGALEATGYADAAREADVTATTAAPIETPRSNPWWTQLWVWVLIAMALGVALGRWAPDTAVQMGPLGDAFIKLIRMLIAPIIFCTVVTGIAHMADMTRVGRVAIKAIVYFEVMTTVALVVGLVAVNILKPGVGMNVDVSKLNPGAVEPYVKLTHEVGAVPFLMNIIPGTFVGAFTDGNILQVLFIAILSGFALVIIGDRAKPLVDIIEIAAKMVFVIVGIIMWTAPLGAFGAIAFTVGKFGIGSLASLGELVLGFYATCIIFIAIGFGPVARFCGFSLLKLIRYIKEELLICIATTSSETVLPRIMDKLGRLGCDKGVVGLVVPTGYSFNLDGTCLYLATAAVFLAQATNTPLDIWHQIGLLLILLVTSKGAAGVAGAAFVVLAATLGAESSIPVASVALVLGIHRLMSQGLTPTNLLGNAVATIVMAKWEGALDESRLHRELDAGS
jgi:aerobic C4-dicarboxylate transport protein